MSPQDPGAPVEAPALELSPAQLRTLRARHPLAAARFPSQPEGALEWMAQEEAWRRGARDAVSGAFHRLALTQGLLLKEDFDAGFHGGEGGWRLGAVMVDLLGFITFNARHGFAEGDRALGEVARELAAAFRGAKVVRIHSDAFAALLGPTAEAQLTNESEVRARAALAGVGARWHPSLEFTVATLDLTLVSPSHHEVIGPLVWAECERALLARKRVPEARHHVRRVVLDALVPDPR